MIVEFFKHGTGESDGPIDYFLGKDRNREHAKLLSGDLAEVAELIDCSPYVKKYTAGCLSFFEDDLPDIQKKTLMSAFEKTLFPGLDPEQYRIVWIEHKDKENEETGEKRLELNFLIPNIEITTGKRLQPFFAKADLTRVDAFKSIVNYKYQLFDPDDPINRRSVKVAKNLPKDKKDFIASINTEVALAITEGLVSDRESLKSWMGEIGLEITRITKRQISVKNPNNPEGKPIPLKGEFYEQNFRYFEQSAELKREQSEKYRREAESRYERSLSRYKSLCESKGEYHLERYATRDRSDSAELTRQLTEQESRNTGEHQRTGGDLEQRYSSSARTATNATTDHETGLADIEQLEPRHRSNSQDQKNLVDFNNSTDFNSLYCSYFLPSTRVHPQNAASGIQRSKSPVEERESQPCRSPSGTRDEHERAQKQIPKAIREVIDHDLRSTTITDYRTATTAAQKATGFANQCIATFAASEQNYRASRGQNQTVGEDQQDWRREDRGTTENPYSFEESAAIRDTFKRTYRDLQTTTRSTIDKVSRQFEYRSSSESIVTQDFRAISTDRARETELTTNQEAREPTGLSRQSTQVPRGFDTENIFKAIDELDRRKQLIFEMNRVKNDYGFNY